MPESESYKKARMAVLKHETTMVLVESGEYNVIDWAKEFAEHRNRYFQVSSVIYDNDIPTDPKTQKALEAGEAFILARAESTWQGKWVDPRWTKAALKRELAKEERAAAILEREDLDFDYPETEPVGSKEQIVATPPKPVMRIRQFMHSVELPSPSSHAKKPPSAEFYSAKVTGKKRGHDSSSEVEDNSSNYAPVRPRRETRQRRRQDTLCQVNSPKCEGCTAADLECISPLSSDRVMACRSCRRKKNRCSLIIR